jgi:ribose-phosphate pyrophosphokinase
VNSISIPSRKTLQVFSGRAYPELAEEIARYLDVRLTPQSAYEFANGEIFVRFDESVRGADAFVIQSCTAPINTWVMETLITIDALKRASADRITVVLPFYPYARQDKKHRGREPISARLISDLLRTAGAHRLMTVDLHTDQIQGFFDGPVDHLFALRLLADHVATKYADKDITVVAPDSGRVRVAERWADRLGGVPLAFIHKTRDPTKPNQVVTNRVVGDVEGRCCVLVDDMIDTGGTITKATAKLFEAGAADVIIAATHGVLSDPAPRSLAECGATEILLTNTLPIPPERLPANATVLSIGPLVAQAIHEVFEDGSVTSLFSNDDKQGHLAVEVAEVRVTEVTRFSGQS